MKNQNETNILKMSDSQLDELLNVSKTVHVNDAVLDIDRINRKGFPEVVLAEGKKISDIIPIMHKFIQEDSLAIASRVSENQALTLEKEFNKNGRWNKKGRVFVANKHLIPRFPYKTSIGIISAGLCDQPTAEEICELLYCANYPLVKLFDVGIAGIHRLILQLKKIEQCDVLIVIAGMEGALPPVVAGLVEQPVIAVPTSVGYGVSEKGKAALYTMLASCSPGISVVNIDNGYGAAMMAHSICMRIHKGGKDNLSK